MNNKVECGGVLLVVYEALEDYCYLMDEGSVEEAIREYENEIINEERLF